LTKFRPRGLARASVTNSPPYKNYRGGGCEHIVARRACSKPWSHGHAKWWMPKESITEGAPNGSLGKSHDWPRTNRQTRGKFLGNGKKEKIKIPKKNKTTPLWGQGSAFHLTVKKILSQLTSYPAVLNGVISNPERNKLKSLIGSLFSAFFSVRHRKWKKEEGLRLAVANAQ